MTKVLILLLFLTLNISLFSQNTPQAQEIFEIENNLQPNTIIKDQVLQSKSIEQRMEELKIPGISIAVIKDGKLHFTKSYGFANTKSKSKVNDQTLFQAGSISKPLAALAALKLVDEGKLKLDMDVNTYLKDWKIPESKFTKKEKVTLRRLLTHTAGITIHGFPGYKESDKFPSIIEVLSGKGNTEKVEVDTEPGKNWRYSGGGYTIIEKIIEDVSELPLETYIAENIFTKLGMDNSTFEQPLSLDKQVNASLAYNRKGKIIDKSFHNYPEQAAAGLWTTATDLAKYIIEIQEIANGKNDGIISTDLAKQMLTKDHNWGLGVSLQNEGDELLFGHGGKNTGFTNNMVAHVYKGDGIIIMTNADNGNELITEIQNAISMHYDLDISSTVVIDVIDLTTEELSKFEGEYKYESDKTFTAKVKVKNGKLLIKVGSWHEMTPVGSYTFRDMKDPETITFSKDDDGNITSFTLARPGIEFKKI